MYSYSIESLKKLNPLWKLKSSSGYGMVATILAVVGVGFLMFPITKWYLGVSKGTDDFADKLEMQSIISDYWNQLNASTYDEFESAIAHRGTTWTENLGDKYEVKLVFSADGKYANAACSVGASVGASDRHCRKVTINIKSKTNPLLAEKIDTIRVSFVGESARLAAMEDRITANENKFGQYYKKTESDTRYIKKGAHS